MPTVDLSHRPRAHARVALAVPLLLALSVAAVAPTARAAGSGETNALQLFEEGRRAFDKKDFAAALASFDGSIKLVASPNTRLYIGRCLRELGKTASARTALLRAAAESHDAAAGGEARYRATEDAARAEAEALAPKIPHLVLSVAAKANDPHVFLDGVEVPGASLGQNLDVDPGAHTVTASAARSQPFTASVDARAGATARLDVALIPKPTAVVHLELADRPAGYSVSLDGKPLEATAASLPIELPPGAHTLVVAAPGRADFTWSQTLADGDDLAIAAALAPADSADGANAKSSFPKWPFFALGGGSIIALGAATALAANAKSISDSEQAKPVAQRSADERDHITSLSHEANAFFIIGGALLVGTGVVGWFTWKSRLGKTRSETAARIVPWVGPGAGGLVTGGTF
jgi:hypothetical protein